MHTLKIHQRAWAILAVTCTVLLTAGCGGGVEYANAAQESALQPVQYSVSETSQPAQANADSFTLKSGKDFNGFNPELWNDHKSWDECDCGRYSQPQPRKMHWDPI